MNVSTAQLTVSTPEATNFNSVDQLQTNFAYYNPTQGTKYKKSNCALLIAATGTIGGFTVAALVDQSTRNDILKGIGVGMASSIAFLWGSVSSLKPITERGLLNAQTQIRQTLRSALIEKTNINKKMEETIKELKQIEPKAIAEHQELANKAQKIFDAELAAYKQDFNNLSVLIGGYIAARSIATAVYCDNYNNNSTAPVDTNSNRRNTSDDLANKYTTAATSFCTFVNQGFNDFWSQQKLIRDLKPCLTASEIIVIQGFMANCSQPPHFHQAKGPNEAVYDNLKYAKQSLAYSASSLKDKIETIQKKHAIEISDAGKIIFPSLQEFATSLPS